MLTKEEIARRFRVLEEAAEAAGEAARDKEMRHTRASQGTERLGLRRDCKASGGHVFYELNFGLESEACVICGAPKDEPAAILARNLGTVSSLDKFAPEVISKAPDALPATNPMDEPIYSIVDGKIYCYFKDSAGNWCFDVRP